MNAIRSVLAFLRLIDENGHLSITNIAVMVILVKIGFMAEIDIMSATALLTTISSYNFKKYIKTKEPAPPIADIKGSNLELILAEINRIKTKLAFSNVK